MCAAVTKRVLVTFETRPVGSDAPSPDPELDEAEASVVSLPVDVAGSGAGRMRSSLHAALQKLATKPKRAACRERSTLERY